jgi:hypothetical protein
MCSLRPSKIFLRILQRKFFACLWLSVITLSLSCTTSDREKIINKETDIALVEKTIHGSIGWAKTKDFTLLYSLIANDSDYVEIDPTPGVLRGISDFKKNEAFWASPNFKAVRYEIRNLKIQLSESGTVAWFYCILDDINEWKGEPACWMNTRWTGVLEKRKGNWIIVQMHFSFASGK